MLTTAEKVELVRWHEARMAELDYPEVIVIELRRSMHKWCGVCVASV